MKLLPYALLLITGVLINSFSQVMLKKAAMKHYESHLREYLNPLVICAYVMSTGVTVLNSFAYRAVPLSMGAVLEALGYVFVTLWSVLIFKEKVGRRKKIGLTLILIGVAVSSFLG